MDLLCKNIFVIFVFTLLSDVLTYDVCNTNATCIALEKCEGLYNRFIQSRDEALLNLLRKLHCGFESVKVPKVCCPPIFEHANTITSLGIFNPMDLLPDMKVCGMQNHDRIYGGILTELDEHPWMALLRYDKPNGSGFYCGGVLISSRYVLTAAHCVKGADLPRTWKLSQVRLGEWNVTSKIDCELDNCSPKPLDVPIEQLIAHEDYDPTDGHQQNDIALLRLSQEIQFNDFVKPICLPHTQELRRNLFEGYAMEVAGWGKTETRSSSDVKLKVLVPVIKNQACQETYKRAGRTITNKQLCAGGLQGEDFCRGDSGGPLMGQVSTMENWMAIGVISYGPSPCGTPGWPGVYSRVTAFMDWILDNIAP